MDPLPPQQQPQYQQPQLPPKSSGAGCCAGGCLTFFIVAFIGLAVLVCVSLYLAKKAITELTSTHSVEVVVEQPTDEQYSAANAKLEQLRTAVHSKQALTTTFTGPELNALIARHPDFAPRHGKMRIMIADSVATIEMSVPLEPTGFPGLRHRWFNGNANFGFIFADEGFRFDSNWIEANGHRLTGLVVHSVASSFGDSFSKRLKDEMENEGGGEFWRGIKTMTLDEDKLVIITRAGE